MSEETAESAVAEAAAQVEESTAASEVAQSDAATEATSEDSGVTDEGDQKPPPKGEPLPKGVQRRIDRAVRDKYEAQARTKMLEERLAALEQQSRSGSQQNTPQGIDNAEPKIENFDNFDAYVAAKAEYIATKKIEAALTERERRQAAEREQRTEQEARANWQRRMIEATAELPDFEDVIATSDVPMSGAMQQAIMESEVGPKLAYYLATNQEEARKIAVMSPLGQVRALGRIEAKLESPAPKSVSNAPPPVKTVAGKSSVKVDPDKMSTSEWLKWRNEQIKKRA